MALHLSYCFSSDLRPKCCSCLVPEHGTPAELQRYAAGILDNSPAIQDVYMNTCSVKKELGFYGLLCQLLYVEAGNSPQSQDAGPVLRVLSITTALLTNLHQKIVVMHSHMFLVRFLNPKSMSDWF